MPTSEDLQYTIRGISKETDQALREEARRMGVSLNRLVVEKLEAAAHKEQTPKKRNLDFLRGRWIEDREFDAAMEAQRVVDLNLWK
jgi:hypothetical protein